MILPDPMSERQCHSDIGFFCAAGFIFQKACLGLSKPARQPMVQLFCDK
jgi:hypothetical protein